MAKLKVAVGSTNRAKVEAVRDALKVIGWDYELIPVSVDSGVSDQPFCEETYYGARNRAKNAILRAQADLGIGIEGGICPFMNRVMGFAVVYAVDSKGRENFSMSPWFVIPNAVASHVFMGLELGHATDLVFDTTGSKHYDGVIKFLTKYVTRKDLYVQAVIIALYPFYNSSVPHSLDE